MKLFEKIKTNMKIPFFTKRFFLASGFSLIELIVVVAIITLISSITLFNHSVFSGGVTLENLAYEIALTVRQAQFFGINVRAVDIDGVSSFQSGYGVYFDMSNPTSFLLFADKNNNHLYDDPTELVEVYNITRGNVIAHLCVDNGCSDIESIPSVEDMHVTFMRPNPDAFIKTSDTADCGVAINNSCGVAMIFVSSPRDNVRSKVITVGSAGQISVGTR